MNTLFRDIRFGIRTLRKNPGFTAVAALIAAATLARVMQNLPAGVSSSDTLTFIGEAIVVTLVTLAASYISARRAMKVDPIVALRCE